MLIDIVVSRDRNVITKEAVKIFKMTYNRDVAYVEYKNETPIPVIKRALDPSQYYSEYIPTTYM